MFKIVAVAGRLRGKEFILNDGENIFGRALDSTFQINSDGISKKHFKITIENDQAYIEDLGSANGTMVNGRLIQGMSLKDGDKIALPNVIFQVVYVEVIKIQVKQSITKTESVNEEDFSDTEPVPESWTAKPIWFFKNKIMPIVYGFNQQYEWSSIVGFLILVFITINISLTIVPVLTDSRYLLQRELRYRAKQYAAEVDRLNNVYLRDKNLDQIYTGFLEGEDAEGVQSYKLFDTDGRVYRPVSELNTIVNDPFAVDSLTYFKVEQNWDKEKIIKEGNLIKIARAIKAFDKNLAREVVVAIITINFAPTSLATEAANNSKAYLESLVTSGTVAIIFFGILYYLTVRPLSILRFEIENVLRGRQKEVSLKLMFQEMTPLKNSINNILLRMQELQNAATGEIQNLDEEGPYVRLLEEFLPGSQGPVMILNSEKIIHKLNPEAEDLLGIRDNASSGQSLLDTLRDQGLAATIIELCDQTANHDGLNQNNTYEIGGKEISIYVIGLQGRDKFIKCYYITFKRND